MPQLRYLWLNRIDLLEGKWDGVVEALRYRGILIPWELISLLGLLRQEVGQWWPCTSHTDREDVALFRYEIYAEDGGHHPSLPMDSHDSLSFHYFEEMFSRAGEERVRD